MIPIKKIVLIISIVIICFSIISCSSDYSSTGDESYDAYVAEVYEADKHLPQLEELGDYDYIKINRRPVRDMFFNTMNSIVLIISYESKDFNDVIEHVEEKYVFLEQKTDGLNDTDAKIGDIKIRVVKNNDSVYPSQFMMIGVDETNSRILYFYHQDIETYNINDLDKFIKKSYNLDGVS